VDKIFLNAWASPNCKKETLHSLQYEYSLADFVRLKEYIEILDAYEQAIAKDDEIENKTSAHK
jgi:hypothetical protein